MQNINIAVVGCRWFTNYSFLYDKLLFHLKDYLNNKDYKITIVSGGAKGVDSLAELFANHFNLNFICYKANWDKFGKSAGYLRNIEIVENSDKIYAFWDSISKGTKHTIDYAQSKNKEVIIIPIEIESLIN